jgi:hypothetical protein
VASLALHHRLPSVAPTGAWNVACPPFTISSLDLPSIPTY